MRLEFLRRSSICHFRPADRFPARLGRLSPVSGNHRKVVGIIHLFRCWVLPPLRVPQMAPGHAIEGYRGCEFFPTELWGGDLTDDDHFSASRWALFEVV